MAWPCDCYWRESHERAILCRCPFLPVSRLSNWWGLPSRLGLRLVAVHGSGQECFRIQSSRPVHRAYSGLLPEALAVQTHAEQLTAVHQGLEALLCNRERRLS